MFWGIDQIWDLRLEMKFKKTISISLKSISDFDVINNFRVGIRFYSGIENEEKKN